MRTVTQKGILIFAFFCFVACVFQDSKSGKPKPDDIVPEAREIGNGGDPLQILFEEQRQALVAKLADLIESGFIVQEGEKSHDWLAKNLEAYRDDIAASPHRWLDTNVDGPTCAFTKRERNAPIEFSYHNCKGRTIDKEGAFKLLAHESVHHFGFDDEVFPTEVALALYSIRAKSADRKSISIKSINFSLAADITMDTSDGDTLALTRPTGMLATLKELIKKQQECEGLFIDLSQVEKVAESQYRLDDSSEIECIK